MNITRKTFAAIAVLLSAGMLSWAARAGDAALYGPAAPKGSAFVRLYNAAAQEADANVGAVRFDEVDPQDSTDFSFLPAGGYDARVGGQAVALRLEANHYYTLVNLPDGAPVLVEEPPFKNRQKALLRVQNLSAVLLSLKTADGRTPVVENVVPQGRGEREVNPVKVSLALFDGERKISDLKSVALERGEVACLFITGDSGRLLPVWVKRVPKAD